MSYRKTALWVSGGGALVLIFASGFPGAQAGTAAGQTGKKSAKTAAKSAKPAAGTGAAAFAAQCAPCHGAKGEGTEAYSRTLTGNMTVAQLATYIAQEMPPGKGQKCSTADAKKIAPYIYDAFYSPIAQERGLGPRGSRFPG
jgi:mono/diheme cytochrome c family protein